MERGARCLPVESSKSSLTKNIFLFYCFRLSLDTTSPVLSWSFVCFFVVRAGWNRIFSLSLFVEHMLLGIEEVEKKLTPVVLEHTRRLAQVGLDFLY